MDLQAFKAKLERHIESAQAAAQRHIDAGSGYGNPMWANHFLDRVAVLKQRLYEVNLEIDSK